LGLRPGLPVHAIIKSIAFDNEAMGGAGLGSAEMGHI
jgi:hypothetical protein